MNQCQLVIFSSEKFLLQYCNQRNALPKVIYKKSFRKIVVNDTDNLLQDEINIMSIYRVPSILHLY